MKVISANMCEVVLTTGVLFPTILTQNAVGQNSKTVEATTHLEPC